MEMRQYEELKKKLCKELETVAERKSMGMAEIEIINKLTDSIKNIDKIEMLEEDGHSEAGYRRYSRGYDGGNWNARGSYADDDYSRDNSYARRGMHYVRGHYSRGADEMDMVMDKISEAMNDGSMTSTEKDTLRRAMDVLRK